MTISFLDMQNMIAFDLRGVNTAIETGFQVHIQEAIRWAISLVDSELFYFNSKVSYTITNPDQELADYYQLPIDYGSIVCNPAIKDDNGKIIRILEKLSNNDLDLLNMSGGKGLPMYFTIINDQLRLGPTPDASYRVTINYVFKYPKLINDGDTNAWLEEAADYVRFKAGGKLAVVPLRNARMASELRPFAEEALGSLRRKTLDWLSLESIIPNDL